MLDRETREREMAPSLFTAICSSASYNLNKYEEIRKKNSDDFIGPEQLKIFKKQKKKIGEALDKSDKKGLDMYRNFEPMSNWVSILRTQQEVFQQIEEEPHVGSSSDFMLTFGNTANNLKFLQTELRKLVRDSIVETKTPNEIRLENIYEDLKNEYERRAERFDQINQSLTMTEVKLENAQKESLRLQNEYKRLDKTLNDLCDERGPEIVFTARKTRLLTVEWKQKKLELLDQINNIKEDIDSFLNKGNKANKLSRKVANIDENISNIKKEYDIKINQIKEAISGTNSTHQSMMSTLNKEQDKTRSTLLYKEKTFTNSELKRIKSGADRLIKKQKRQFSLSLKQIEKNAKKATASDFDSFLQLLREDSTRHLTELKQIMDEQIRELQEISQRHTDDINDSINKRIENLFFITETTVVQKETKKERLSAMIRDKTFELDSITSQVTALESIITDVSKYLEYLEQTKGAPRIILDEKASEKDRMKYESMFRCSELAEFNKRASEIIQRIQAPFQKISTGSVSDPIPKGITPFGSALGNYIEGLQVTLEEEPRSSDSILFSGSTYADENLEEDQHELKNLSIIIPFYDESLIDESQQNTSIENNDHIETVNDDIEKNNISDDSYINIESNPGESMETKDWKKHNQNKEIFVPVSHDDNSSDLNMSSNVITDNIIEKSIEHHKQRKENYQEEENKIHEPNNEHEIEKSEITNTPKEDDTETNQKTHKDIKSQKNASENIKEPSICFINDEIDSVPNEFSQTNINEDISAPQIDETKTDKREKTQEESKASNIETDKREKTQEESKALNIETEKVQQIEILSTAGEEEQIHFEIDEKENKNLESKSKSKEIPEEAESQLNITNSVTNQRINFESFTSDEYANSDSSLSNSSNSFSFGEVKAPLQIKTPTRSPRALHAKQSISSSEPESSSNSKNDISLLDFEGLMEFAGLPPGSSAKVKSPRRKNGSNYSTRSKAKKADLLKPKSPSPSSSSASSLSSAPPFGSFPGVVRSSERPEFCDEEEVKRVRNEVDARTRTLVKKNLGIASSSSDVPPPKRARRKCKVKRAERAPIAVGSGVPKLPKAKSRKTGKEPITAISIRRWYGRDP